MSRRPSLPPRARPRRAGRAAPAASSLLAVPALLALAAAPGAAHAQTIHDGLSVPHRQLRLSVGYGHESWDRYWEGTRERSNDNIGTVTTQSIAATIGYGLTERVSLFAALPYVRTKASQGVLAGMEGWQDVTVAAKVRLVETPVAGRASLGVAVAGIASTPASDYTPDFQPLSIGLGATGASARGTLHLRDRSGFFAEGAAGRTWRSTVTLDRPAYYTDGQLVLSDEVAMPDVWDWAVGAGYQGHGLCLPIMLVGQRTLGGGDIRRQDMPFVSNRMDFTRLQVRAMYTLPAVSWLTLEAGAARTLHGRNVGKSTGLAVGVTTAFGL